MPPEVGLACRLQLTCELEQVPRTAFDVVWR